MARDETKNAVQKSAPATLHHPVTPSNTENFDFGVARALRALTDGVLAVVDQNGTVINYPVVAGDVIDVECIRVNSTDTTATCAAWQ